MKQNTSFDVIIVGGGHAGVEAALVCSFKGLRVCIVTMDPQAVGRMSCNPAVGGLAKGQLVREIDLLGGAMATVADQAGIQFKVLNRSKGRSVWSPRAQVDKRLYERTVVEKIKKSSAFVLTGEVVDLKIKHNRVVGVVLRSGEIISCSSCILTCGTFLSGVIHIGERKASAGRLGETPAEGLTTSLVSLGFRSSRLKTGTPPRLNKKTIDWSKTKEELGDKNPTPFSLSSLSFSPPNVPCHSIRTNTRCHDVIKKNAFSSPMFSGDIDAVGPRYCPSIEDKVFRFGHHNSHHLFLEPEWSNSDQIYVNGFSTSLPEKTQLAALRSIQGLKNVEFLRPGYAIEYDFFPPSQLKSTLESKDVSGLFFSGQINGTSGYEEAAAQGLVAGINACAFVSGLEPLVLRRDDSYIGVMIDDLITKDTLEPYRMFTSRAEYRLLLRYSNTDVRLFQKSKMINTLTKQRQDHIVKRLALRDSVLSAVKASVSPDQVSHTKTTINQKMPLVELIKRPEFSIFDAPKDKFSHIDLKELPRWSSDEVFFDVESQIKYEGYIKRHLTEIDKINSSEKTVISKDIDYSSMSGLSLEGKEKFSLVRPETLGQASRIAGITPSDISVLLVYLRRKQC